MAKRGSVGSYQRLSTRLAAVQFIFFKVMYSAAFAELGFIFLRLRLARALCKAFAVRWAAQIAIIFGAAARAAIDGLAAWVDRVR